MQSKQNLSAALVISLLAIISIVATVNARSIHSTASNDRLTAPASNAEKPDQLLQPSVRESIHNDTSPALRDLKPSGPVAKPASPRSIPNFPLPRKGNYPQSPSPLRIDQVLPDQPLQVSSIISLTSFDGVNNLDGVFPPDTQGDIGFDPATGKKYYIQWVNLHYAMWDVTVTPTLIAGPDAGNTLWQGFGGDCENTNDGDPITVFDPIAHRWLMSQFAVSGPYYQCIAISASADPTGAWYRYAFEWKDGNDIPTFNDYGKWGVWPDGYYFTANQFDSEPDEGALSAQALAPDQVAVFYKGAGAAVFERDRMLKGQSARMIYFDLNAIDPTLGGMLPTDLDGLYLPPAGASNYFAEVDDSALSGVSVTTDSLRLWKFHTDWITPANSTFGINGAANYTLTVNAFKSLPCVAAGTLCIPQQGTSTELDGVADRLMYRLTYRNFGDHETLLVNHTVWADGADRAGVRWYEVRSPGSSPSIYQQGTFAPADGLYRWMGSLAMDHNGDIALGYSVGSSTLYPSIRVTGRLVSDTLGQLPQGEAAIITGTGNQIGSLGRWGDYSTMSIDPSDDCTFWYTQEYIQTSGTANWRTRIASFKFPDCQAPLGTLRGSITNSLTSNPISGVLVTASLAQFYSINTQTNISGQYSLMLISGTYTVTALAYGYLPAPINNVTINAGLTTTQNISLTPAPSHIVSGTIRDGLTGWPLYAQLQISGNPIDPPSPNDSIWNDPVSGFYSITLADGISYTFKTTAWISGYIPTGHSLFLTADATQNFSLTTNVANCIAPGYQFVGAGLSQDFETWPPAGWSIVDNVSGNSLIWNLDSAYGDGNYTGGSGHAADVNSDKNSNVPYDAELRSPALNLNTFTSTLLSYKLNYQHYISDVLDVDISTNGGASWTNLRHFITDQGLDSSLGTSDTINLSAYVTQTNVILRWRYYAVNSKPWDWYAQIDQVRLGQQPQCVPQAGGLVVGNTYRANDLLPLIGVQVTNDSDRSFTSTATVDPNVADSFYTLFSLAGSRVFTGTKYNYLAAVTTTNVVQSSTVRQDLYLPSAPDLSINKFGPSFAQPGNLISYTLVYTNAGVFTATNVLITDTLPISITASVPTTWNIGTLSGGSGGVIILTATLDSQLSGSTWLTNTALIASNEVDAYPGNNSTYSTLAICTSIDGVDFTFNPLAPRPLQTVSFSTVITGGSLPITYSWHFGDGGVGIGQPINHAYPLTTSVKTYTVTLTASNVCSNLNALHSITITPKLIYLPIALKNF